MSGRPEREEAAKARSKIRRELDDEEVVVTPTGKRKKCTDNNIGPTRFKGKSFCHKDGKTFYGLPPSNSNTPHHSSNSGGNVITALFAIVKGGVGENKIPYERDSSML